MKTYFPFMLPGDPAKSVAFEIDAKRLLHCNRWALVRDLSVHDSWWRVFWYCNKPYLLFITAVMRFGYWVLGEYTPPMQRRLQSNNMAIAAARFAERNLNELLDIAPEIGMEAYNAGEVSKQDIYSYVAHTLTRLSLMYISVHARWMPPELRDDWFEELHQVLNTQLQGALPRLLPRLEVADAPPQHPQQDG